MLWCHVVPFLLLSIALLWPSEWEIISRLFIVDQPISIHCLEQATPSGPTTQYTTQPGKRVQPSAPHYFYYFHKSEWVSEKPLSFLLVISTDVNVFSLVQICVGSAERVSFSSSRGTSESTPKQLSTSAKSSRTRGYQMTIRWGQWAQHEIFHRWTKLESWLSVRW